MQNRGENIRGSNIGYGGEFWGSVIESSLGESSASRFRQLSMTPQKRVNFSLSVELNSEA